MLLFPSRPRAEGRRQLPDWAHIRDELCKASVTLLILWEEYRQEHADGYSYSHYCDLYREWRSAIDPVMRIEHMAGDKLFVDYAGQTVPVLDWIGSHVRAFAFFGGVPRLVVPDNLKSGVTSACWRCTIAQRTRHQRNVCPHGRALRRGRTTSASGAPKR